MVISKPSIRRSNGSSATGLTSSWRGHTSSSCIPDDVASTATEMAKLAAGVDTTNFENRYRCQDGSYRWVSWSIKVDAGAGLLYCVASDVTERRLEQDLMDQLVTELQRSNADLGQFAYVASHDLSEPLRMVTSYMRLLADRYSGQLDADADEFIGYAVDGATRMKVLIDDLLAYSKAGRVAPVRRSVDCSVLLSGVMADLDGVVSDVGAVVDVGGLPVLLTDPGLLASAPSSPFRLSGSAWTGSSRCRTTGLVSPTSTGSGS